MIWLLIGLCCLAAFVFNGIEAGILAVNRVRLAHHARQKDAAAIKLETMLEHPDRLLITVLMATNFANICALVLLIGELVPRLGVKGYVCAGVIYLPLYLFVLELLPKSIFRRFPYRALAAVAEPLRIVDFALAPVHAVGGLVQRVLFGGAPVMPQRVNLGREDFKFFAAEGERSGTITKAESEMITNVVEFRGVMAKDVMKPMKREQVMRAEASVSELLERSAAEKRDRWLVLGDDGAVTGLVSAFDVLIEGRRDVNIGVYQRRVVTVNPEEPAYSVLRKLRAARGSIAVVRGPGAEPLGLLTWSALVRKLVTVAGK